MNFPPPSHLRWLRQHTRRGSCRGRIARVVVVGLLVSGLTTTALDSSTLAFAQSAEQNTGQRNDAPTVPGAPFLPVSDRTQHVIERYETLVAIETLDLASETLASRTVNGLSTTDAGVLETSRILDAQRALLERTLADLAQREPELLAETAQFGIGLAVFPVDEVRKPFWDDWGRPRSGGRRHVGTDVLAQIGVPLRAIEDATIESLPRGGNGGNGIFMIGASGSRYYYAHMDQVGDFEPGDRVLAGQPVGTVGATGNARGAPHLHMQWDPNGGAAWQNPFPMLDVLFGEGRTHAAAEAASDALAAEVEGLANSDIDGNTDGDADEGADVNAVITEFVALRRALFLEETRNSNDQNSQGTTG